MSACVQFFPSSFLPLDFSWLSYHQLQCVIVLVTVWVFGCFDFAGGGFMYPIFQLAFRSTCVSLSLMYTHTRCACVYVVYCGSSDYMVLSTHLRYVWICMYIGTHTHARTHTWPHVHAKIRNLSRSLEILRVAFHFSWIPSRPLLLALSLLLLMHFSLRCSFAHVWID